MQRCPGQDMRTWTPDDIFDVECPFCGAEIEFWKDEPSRLCRECGHELRNPRINLGCARWCKSARECLGTVPEAHIAAAPIIECLRAALARTFAEMPETLRQAEKIHSLADTLISVAGGDPCVIKAGALLSVVRDPSVRNDLLARIGVDEERSHLLAACLNALAEGGAMAAVECAAIADAVAINAFAESANRGAEDLNQLVASLRLDGAKVMARRRFAA